MMLCKPLSAGASVVRGVGSPQNVFVYGILRRHVKRFFSVSCVNETEVPVV